MEKNNVIITGAYSETTDNQGLLNRIAKGDKFSVTKIDSEESIEKLAGVIANELRKLADNIVMPDYVYTEEPNTYELASFVRNAGARLISLVTNTEYIAEEID